MVYHAGAGDAHIDDAVGLTHPMEGPGHKGVILHGVAEHHQLGAAQPVGVTGQMGRLLDDATHAGHGVHVDARLGGAHIHGGAHQFRFVQGLGDALDQGVVTRAKALVDQGGVAADEVDAHRLGSPVQGLGKVDGGCRRAGPGDHGNGGDGDALVDDGDAILPGDVLAGLHQVLGIAADLIVDLLSGLVHIGVDAVQQGDAHGDGAHVQVFVVDHMDRF